MQADVGAHEGDIYVERLHELLRPQALFHISVRSFD
jgi:hypothetical protein